MLREKRRDRNSGNVSLDDVKRAVADFVLSGSTAWRDLATELETAGIDAYVSERLARDALRLADKIDAAMTGKTEQFIDVT